MSRKAKLKIIETVNIPKEFAEVVYRRCDPFLDLALDKQRHWGKDMFKILMLPCYMQGYADIQYALENAPRKDEPEYYI